jgi:5-methyltetrahydrofolate--homocysteine methyltransferase
MDIYKQLNESVIAGNRNVAAELTQKLLDEGKAAKEILDNGLLPAMAVVGDKFEKGEFFIPEMLMAARAMNAGLDLLKPLLETSDVEPVARVVMGTVKGDIHDIGKNLVGMMLRGAGFEVIDAGVDVPPEKFIEMAKANNADIVGLSALLTTTMPSMKDIIEAFKESGIRDQVKIMIGGAPVTEDYAESIGADGYSANAASAVHLAKKLIGIE